MSRKIMFYWPPKAGTFVTTYPFMFRQSKNSASIAVLNLKVKLRPTSHRNGNVKTEGFRIFINFLNNMQNWRVPNGPGHVLRLYNYLQSISFEFRKRAYMCTLFTLNFVSLYFVSFVLIAFRCISLNCVSFNCVFCISFRCVTFRFSCAI